MRRDERDAVAARGLLDRGARERVQRGARRTTTRCLDRGFEPAGEREAADREHRVPELQQARQRAACWRRVRRVVIARIVRASRVRMRRARAVHARAPVDARTSAGLASTAT